MEVAFVPPENDSNEYLSSLATGLKECGINVQNNSWNSYFPLLSLVWLGEKPDVIHIHWLDVLIVGSTTPKTLAKGFRTLFELSIVKLLDISIVWTVHNLESHQKKYPQWEMFYRRLLPRVYFDHLISHCNSAKESINREYKIGSSLPISVIPHGNYIGKYPPNKAGESVYRELDIDSDRNVLMFFGQIKPYKQVPYLIDIFKSADVPDTTLLIVGNPDSNQLEREIMSRSQNREDINTKLEFIPNEEVSKYFNVVDATVLPYRNILTSGTAILSMSHSCPVVVPELGCLSELITDGDEGICYNPNNRGLEHAIERAIDSDLRSMGDTSYRKIRKFDWNSIAQDTVAVYEH